MAVPLLIVFADLVVKFIVSQLFEPGDRVQGLFGWLAIGNHRHYLSSVEVGTRGLVVFAMVVIGGVLLDLAKDPRLTELHPLLKSAKRGILWGMAGGMGILADLALHGGRYVVNWLQIADWAQPVPPWIFTFNLSDVILYIAVGSNFWNLVRLMKSPQRGAHEDLPLQAQLHVTPAHSLLPQTCPALHTAIFSL